MDEFNYIIAYVLDNTSRLITYTLFHEVSFGPQQKAEEFLEYVKRQSPKNDWKIIKISLQ